MLDRYDIPVVAAGLIKSISPETSSKPAVHSADIAALYEQHVQPRKKGTKEKEEKGDRHLKRRTQLYN